MLRLSFLLGLLSCCVSGVVGQTRLLDQIVAVVEDQPILRSEVDTRSFLYVQSGYPYSAKLWEQALEELIRERILLIRAKEDTLVKVSEDQVERELEQRLNQLVRQLGSEERVQQLYGKPLVQIKSEFREEVRNQLLIQEYQRLRLGTIRATRPEVEAWFRSIPEDSLPLIPTMVELAHIVAKPRVNPEARARALALAQALRDSLRQGKDFAQLARRYSQDPGTAPEGGYLGEFHLSELIPEFAAAASALEPGQISEVVETPFGFHLIRLHEKRGDVIATSHILIRLSPEALDPGPAIEKLRALRDSILVHRRPFHEMARKYSEDPETAPLGGQILNPQTGQRSLPLEALDPLFRETVDTLQVGQISHPGPFQMLDGKLAYHIVWLQRRVEAHRANLEQDYPQLEQVFLAQKRQQVLEELVRQAARGIYVEIRIPLSHPIAWLEHGP
jgi:peptidyl-prolyl cis-trans isomerase SurA|nr:MAG: peptidylprolyl isomerase [Bacteroidota bacterium]